MSTREPLSKRKKAARQRQMARERRGGRGFRFPAVPDFIRNSHLLQRLVQLLREGLWYLVNRTPALKILAGLVVLYFVVFILSHVLGGLIYPNVWAMGIPLGDLTVEEAEARLVTAWYENVYIQVNAGGEKIVTLQPAQLGITIDALATAEAARGVGLAGIPFGYNVDPVVSIDSAVAQDYLFDLTSQVNQLPKEAGFEWRNDQLMSVNGAAGRTLDVLLTLDRIVQNPESIITNRRLELMTNPVPPQVEDASPLLKDAFRLIADGFNLIGYDPFHNEFLALPTTRDEVLSWLIATPTGLAMRSDTFDNYIAGINQRLDVGERPRYIDKNESIEILTGAVQRGENYAELRIRNLETTYEVVPRDTGFRIGRKTGIPFQLLKEANPGLNWEILSVGQVITLPSRDTLLQHIPVAHKRIVVDLDNQWLVAYEDGEMVFNWQISSGIENAPTYPGVFQILTHQEKAFGSGFSLCGEGQYEGCDQWEMNWFMGVYEVIPGLMNGFHGEVLLPNGTRLGQSYGIVGAPATFGCIMSLDDVAKQLYDWAETGTMVEIISWEFEPESELGRQARDFILSNL